MTKEWQPKKIKKFTYPKASAKVIDEWFIRYANLNQINQATGIARSTMYRWKNLIQKENKSLQDFMTITEYQKIIELELQDYQDFRNKKAKVQEKKDKLNKQARVLTEQLSAKGFKVKIEVPDDIKISRKAKKEAKFKEIYVLEKDSDPKKQAQSKALLRKLSETDRKAYEKYKKDLDE